VSSLAADRRPRLILEIDIRKRLSVVVAYNKTGGLFFDGPMYHSDVLKIASELSMDLRHSLDPIDKLSRESIETVATLDEKHQMNVSILSEILSRLYAYLNRTAEPH